MKKWPPGISVSAGRAHNEEVARSGMGNAGKKGRRTLALARNRYRVFKERTYDALVSPDLPLPLH
jgi:hypothetical protein